jgi:uncharacterized protein YlxP (DUF503 family)
MSIGLLLIHIQLPGCTSLKEKRHRLKPLLARLHREFNISIAEVDKQDVWIEAQLAIAIVSNDPNHNQRALQLILSWLETNWPDVLIVENHIELI